MAHRPNEEANAKHLTAATTTEDPSQIQKEDTCVLMMQDLMTPIDCLPRPRFKPSRPTRRAAQLELLEHRMRPTRKADVLIDDGKLGGSGDRNANSASSKEELGGNSTDSFPCHAYVCPEQDSDCVNCSPDADFMRSLQRGQQTYVSQALLRKPKLSLPRKRRQAPRSESIRQQTHPQEGG